mgnify:CR=1 FL=1
MHASLRRLMNVRIDESWKNILADEFEKPYFAELVRFVRGAYARGVCYPPAKLIFNAFDRTPFDQVKVVILGQDPYHNPRQAHGLCFSVQKGVALPPSLVNIYKELQDEFGGDFLSRDGDLTHWAEQGVLLLNATLTVAGGDSSMAGSHQGRGWETFTDAVVRKLAEKREGLVYLLWGSYAQRKASFVDRAKNLVLATAHPSPLSAYRGFFGCGHFKTCNDYLVAHGKEPIRW